MNECASPKNAAGSASVTVSHCARIMWWPGLSLLCLLVAAVPRGSGTASGGPTSATADSACVVPQSLEGWTAPNPRHLQIRGPTSSSESVTWLDDLRSWRARCLAGLKLSGDIYNVAQLEWGKTAYFQPLMMPFDRHFYNATLGNYTVARYLSSLKEQYGGIDSALLWPTCERTPQPLPHAWLRTTGCFLTGLWLRRYKHWH
jgi:hypothetical protein